MAERTDSPGRRDWMAAGGITLLALLLRLLYLRDITRSGLGDFLRLDPLYYHEWALRIARGELRSSQPFEMSPLYPYALGAIYRLFGPALSTPRLLQAILGAITCGGTALLAHRLFGRAAGIIAGTTLALYGPAIYYDGQINKTTLALALSLSFAGALVLSRGRHRGWIAAGGIALGLAAMVHENVDVAAPLILLWLVLAAPSDPVKARLARAGIFVAGWAIAVAPATLHNYLATREIVLITTGGGENFYTGNHENASGRYAPPPFVRPDPFYEHEDFRAEAARRLGHPVTRSESSRYWWREGLRFIEERPLPYVALLWDKLGVFWNSFERPDNFSYDNFRLFSPTLSLPLPAFGIVAPLALLGAGISLRRWRDLLPLYAGFGAYFISAMIFFTQSRYRMPAVPFLSIFAANGAVGLAGFLSGRNVRAVAASLVLLAGAFLFVNRDPGNAPSFQAQNEAILGELYDNAGRFDEAAAAFRRGIDGIAPFAAGGNPTFTRILGAAEYGLGLTERRRGDEAASESALRAATACPDPDVRADAAAELAEILDSRGDASGLASELGIVIEARPMDFRSRLRRAEALFKLGRLPESLAETRAVLSLEPPAPPLDQADAHYGAAMIEIANGEESNAEDDLRRVLDLNPAHPQAAWIRGRIHGGAGTSR
jgi:tetratricopeptide (TPR) repeat protein